MELRKICLTGEFAVGKTSLVRRFVSNIFSDDYITTVGVKVETRVVTLSSGEEVKLVIWDMAGSSALTTVSQSYLQGASGYLLVADGTRPETYFSALNLKGEIDAFLKNPPSIGLLNKADLKEAWAITDDMLALSEAPDYWRKSSALTGEAVEQAFLDLAEAMA
ncbi:MAG TPA: GTP-binding protein [Gammaproteobacteria bacterium]|nr:GTP-binding protein [Gammaproteobacteria bacterium]